MVYYEPRVTQADKDHITHRLSKYVMDIRHDHELYRHLHCYWPDDPIGPNNCSFDVITAPGSITIYGDWMHAFTLRRYGDQDMLRDFCNTKELAINYWAEKLDVSVETRDAAVMAIDTDDFFEDIGATLTEWLAEEGIPQDDYTVDFILDRINDNISFDDARHPFEQLLNCSIEIAPGMDVKNGSDIFDSAYVPGEHCTLEWIRTCMALQWAARTYAAAQSYKKQEQTRRYLATQKHMTMCEHPPLVKPPVVGI